MAVNLIYSVRVFSFFMFTQDISPHKRQSRRCSGVVGHQYECAGVASWHSSAKISECMEGTEMGSRPCVCAGVRSNGFYARNSEGT